MSVVLTDVFGVSDPGGGTTTDGRIVRGLKIFKTGTLRDSMGVTRKWTVGHLRQMVDNFHALRNSGTLPNIPVRENHSRDVRNVVGYFADLRVEGRFLVADVEFTEPDALGKYERGTYRARSAEIGSYTDENGTEYTPAMLGVAFCDIPAVEGLYEAALATYSAKAEDVHLHATASAATKKPADGDSFSTVDDALKDILIDLHRAKDLAAGDSDTETALQQIVDAVQLLVDDSDDTQTGGENADAGGQSTSQHAAPGPNDGRKNAASTSQEDSVDLIKFSLGASEVEIPAEAKPALEHFVSQYAALTEANSSLTTERDTLKTENDSLKAEKVEASFAARDSKVDTWVAGGKMAPAQAEAAKAYCRTLSDEQFTAHSALVEAQPALKITTPVATGAPGSEPSEQDKTVAEHSATLKMLKLAGVDGERLKESKPFKALVALGQNPEV